MKYWINKGTTKCNKKFSKNKQNYKSCMRK